MLPTPPPDLPPQRRMGARPDVDWEGYRNRVLAEYLALLDSQPSEAVMQAFFERNPSAMPGAFPDGGGHGPWLDGLITQPKLRGIDDRRPDFMWVSRNTVEICPILIEIESPAKKWIVGAPKNSQSSHELTQATNQLRQWEEWFAQPANEQVFRETYRLPPAWADRPLSPQFWLIMGRTSENPKEIAKLRRYLSRGRVRVFTYDSEPFGEPWSRCDQFVTIAPAGSGAFEVKHVPPTIVAWDAVDGEEWRAVTGREEAVIRSTEINDEHKRLLIDDLALMDEWLDALDAYEAARAASRRASRPS